MLDLLLEHGFEGVADGAGGHDGHDVAGGCVSNRAVVSPFSFSKEIAAGDDSDASALVVYYRVGPVSFRLEALGYLSHRGGLVDGVDVGSPHCGYRGRGQDVGVVAGGASQP